MDMVTILFGKKIIAVLIAYLLKILLLLINYYDVIMSV